MNNDTPLYEASKCGYVQIVKVLLKAGANVNAMYGRALESARAAGHGEIVEMLLKASTEDPLTLRFNRVRLFAGIGIDIDPNIVTRFYL
jgi:ankyrin repeat protein